MRSTRKIAYLHYFLLSACLIIFVFNSLCFYNSVIDDAYISFRYARNFADGKGLVFNEGERVEGYSNFLWTILLGLLMKLFRVDLMFWAKLLGILFSLATIALLYFFSQLLLGRKSLFNLFPALFLALNPYYAHWAVMGLETNAFIFLVVLTFYLAIREQKRKKFMLSPFVAALAIMTRPEGPLFVIPPLILFAAWLVWRREIKIERILTWASQFLVLFLPFFIWRFIYYDDILPNTYYAKLGQNVGHSRGLAHLFYFYFTQGWGFLNLWLIPLLVALLFPNRYSIITVSGLLLSCYYVYHVNGDWMPNYRFMLIALPFIFLNLPLALRTLRWKIKAPPAHWIAGIVLLLMSWDIARFSLNEESVYIFDWSPQRYGKHRSEWYQPRQLYFKFFGKFVPPLQNVTDWLFNHVPEGATVVTSDIGYPSYLNFFINTVDIDGLTDRVISGAAGIRDIDSQAEYILAKRPEYILIFKNHSRPDPKSPGYVYPDLSRRVSTSQDFHQNYLEVMALNKYLNSFVHIYKRNDVTYQPDKDEINRRFKKAIEYNPRMAYLYIELANRFYQQGDKHKALDIGKMAIRKFRGDVEILNRIGHLAFAMGDNELGNQAFQRSLKVKPRQHSLYRQVADSNHRNNKLKQPKATLKRGLKYFPNDYYLYICLASVNQTEKDWPAAEKNLLKATQLVKNRDPRPLNELAMIYERQGKTQKAIEYYSKSLSIKENQLHIRKRLDELQSKPNKPESE